MAKGLKGPIATSWKPGQSGNPKGRAKMPEELKQAKALTHQSLHEAMNSLMHLSREELKERLQDPSTNMIHLLIGSIITKGVQLGDQQRLNFIIERLLGKVKDNIEVTNIATIERAKQLEAMSTEQLKERRAQLLEEGNDGQ